MNPSTKNIDNLLELQAEIRMMKQRIKEREADFEDRWQRLPQETIKATLGSIVPLFLNNKIAGGTWSLLKSVTYLFAGNKNKEEGWKETIAGPVKQLGIFGALKMLYGVFKK